MMERECDNMVTRIIKSKPAARKKHERLTEIKAKRQDAAEGKLTKNEYRAMLNSVTNRGRIKARDRMRGKKVVEYGE